MQNTGEYAVGWFTLSLINGRVGTKQREKWPQLEASFVVFRADLHVHHRGGGPAQAKMTALESASESSAVLRPGDTR